VPAARTRDATALLATINAKVFERLDRPLAVHELAASIGIARRTLEHACQAAFQQSPKEIVNAIRLDEARARISASVEARASNIAQVARTVGFASYRAFLRAYKSRYGSLPRNFATK
jgi:transcriptional regulator GlxA family with amidase domain